MNVRVHPGKNNLNGVVYMPSSKAILHRAIICASLASGTSILREVSLCDDCQATINACQKLKANIDFNINDKTLTINGVNNEINCDSNTINCKESGTTLRLMMPLFALSNKNFTFIGENNLLSRPIEEYQEIFTNNGGMLKANSEYINILGGIKPGTYKMKGNQSSQFTSGMMLVLPLLSEDSTLILDSGFQSYDYVKMSADIMSKFGVNVIFNKKNEIFIPGNQKYKACDLTIEGDYSQFSYFAALGAINNGITIKNLNHCSLQGDKRMVDFLKQMKVNISEITNGYLIEKSILDSARFDIKNCIDIGVTLAMMGAFCNGVFYIDNTARLQFKESNRMDNIVRELKKVGVDINNDENSISIIGKEGYSFEEDLDSCNDHRIFMSLVILATMMDKPVIIRNWECVTKSYPNFLKDLFEVGITVDIIKNTAKAS